MEKVKPREPILGLDSPETMEAERQTQGLYILYLFSSYSVDQVTAGFGKLKLQEPGLLLDFVLPTH